MIKNEFIKTLLTLNPMAAALDIFRAALTHTEINVQVVATGFCISLVLFIVGIITFRKTEAYFADIA
jgi:lipopolysaccharide transport system permease protein